MACFLSGRLTVACRLYLLVGISIVALSLCAVWALILIEEVKVHGQHYTRIAMSKDLIADIMPPPEFIVESYLTGLQLVDATESANLREVADRVERLGELKDQFAIRNAFWVTYLDDDAMRVQLLVEAYEPAMRFYDVIDRELIPACQKGDVETARSIIQGTARDSYEQHKLVIDRLVASSTKMASSTESKVRARVVTRRAGLVVICAVAIFSVAVIGIRTVRGTIAPMQICADNISSKALRLKDTSAEIATAIQQLEGSIRLISRNAMETAEVSQQAVNAAESTEQVLSKLGRSCSEIGDVIAVIQRITHQTNLLALNATIEAARAGESGRGFAVVAREVKELAGKTREAAMSITRQIDGIRHESESALATMNIVTEVMLTIRTGQQSIATAVEEQSAMTAELGRGVHHIADSSLSMTLVAGAMLGNSGDTPVASLSETVMTKPGSGRNYTLKHPVPDNLMSL